VTGIAFGFPKGGPIKQKMPLGANRSTVFFISSFAYKNKIFDDFGETKTPTFVRAFFALRRDRDSLQYAFIVQIRRISRGTVHFMTKFFILEFIAK